MEGSPFLPLSDGLHIEQVTPSTHELLVHVLSSSPTACCPLCGVQAWRIHSRYTRQWPTFLVLVGTSRCCSRSASSFVPMLPARAPFCRAIS